MAASYASSVRIDVTEREAVSVLYSASAGGPEQIPDLARTAWDDLETRVPVRGRKAYGYWIQPPRSIAPATRSRKRTTLLKTDLPEESSPAARTDGRGSKGRTSTR